MHNNGGLHLVGLHACGGDLVCLAAWVHVVLLL